MFLAVSPSSKNHGEVVFTDTLQSSGLILLPSGRSSVPVCAQ